MEQYWWQCRTGKPKKRKWSWVSEELNAHLELCHERGEGETTFRQMGGIYYFDLQALMQTSPWNGEEREIRRTLYEVEA